MTQWLESQRKERSSQGTEDFPIFRIGRSEATNQIQQEVCKKPANKPTASNTPPCTAKESPQTHMPQPALAAEHQNSFARAEVSVVEPQRHM